ncbi:hypothetical protein HZ326_17736 [Fusarium oxysporum f. sp. albedinis]|nr:hypothetical protein HZ326_17736 [Fusarium oxysporum f. sp. albedinis]
MPSLLKIVGAISAASTKSGIPDFYKDFNSVQGDPLGLGVHFPRQQARVNVNMFVARLADSVACWALFGI